MINTNPRIGTSVNLNQGGLYDLLMVDLPDGYPEGELLFNIVDVPRKITGLQKVAQFFLKILLTTKGSNVIYPTQGTRFPNITIGANRTADDQVFRAELITAIRDAESQTKYLLGTSTDLSSQLSRVDIIGIDIGAESLTIFLYIETRDGAYAQVAVPFPEMGLT